MPQSIPPGLTRDHVLRALADLDAKIDHPFGAPTGYELVHEGKRYPPKAVIGLACRYSLGRLLRPEEFSGGEAPGQANFVRRKLGFTVAKKGENLPEDGAPPTRDWSGQEVRLVVADYFARLTEELLGKPADAAESRKTLILQLDERTEEALALQQARISAVLAFQGLPYLGGAVPRENGHALLDQEVEAFLDGNPGFLDQLIAAPALDPDKPPVAGPLDLDAIIEEPPERIMAPKEPSKPWLYRKGRRIDFAQRDAANRRLGRLGEEFVVQLERHRLEQAGREDLAQKVEWVTQTVGDGLGFDVLSFDDADDSEKLIEVKTTGLGKYFPFYATANEVRCSDDRPEQFHLFRLFDFGKRPRAYILTGALSRNCRLEPALFRAVI
jgi:hypothetical protein